MIGSEKDQDLDLIIWNMDEMMQIQIRIINKNNLNQGTGSPAVNMYQHHAVLLYISEIIF